MNTRKKEREKSEAVEQERVQAIAEELDIPVERVTLPLLAKISDDPVFLHHLSMCKGDPQMLNLLLGAETYTETQPEFRTSELVSRASVAMARWAASGFGRVPEGTYHDRIATCWACEHLSMPPNSGIYRVARLSQEKSICGLCGCNVRRKAALPSEHCPDGRWEAFS
ncbi:hypothetical protein [Streptomyces sp. NPDC001436]